MSEILETARAMRDRMYIDSTHAKNREEYIRTVANYNDAARIVTALEEHERAQPA